jgi:hypothetical protein
MRRPNRSIEVLDISLMAVVTKAMGAFLVLMVVFMQYYSSQPLGQQTAQQITQQVEQTQRDLTEVLRKVIAKATPEDIAKLLEEMRRRLEEAKKLIEQLRRDNDALNAQVQRLEQENAALEQEIAELEKKLSTEKFLVTATLLNWDCPNIRFRVGLVTPKMYIVRTNNRQDPNVINFGASLGQSGAIDDESHRRTFPNSKDALGMGERFNLATLRYITDPGTFGIVVVKQHTSPQKIGEYDGYAITRSKQDCAVVITMQSALPGKDLFRIHFAERYVIPKDSYAEIVSEIQINPQTGGLNTVPTSQDTLAWLKNQIANAVKVSP